MALLPDPTTAASEGSSIKNRPTGSRGRKTSLRGVQAQGAGASRESRGGPGGPRGSRRGQGGVQGQSLCNQPQNKLLHGFVTKF